MRRVCTTIAVPLPTSSTVSSSSPWRGAASRCSESRAAHKRQLQVAGARARAPARCSAAAMASGIPPRRRARIRDSANGESAAAASHGQREVVQAFGAREARSPLPLARSAARAAGQHDAARAPSSCREWRPRSPTGPISEIEPKHAKVSGTRIDGDRELERLPPRATRPGGNARLGDQQDRAHRTERQPEARRQRRERIEQQHREQRDRKRLKRSGWREPSTWPAAMLPSMISVRCVGTERPASTA